MVLHSLQRVKVSCIAQRYLILYISQPFAAIVL